MTCVRHSWKDEEGEVSRSSGQGHLCASRKLPGCGGQDDSQCASFPGIGTVRDLGPRQEVRSGSPVQGQADVGPLCGPTAGEARDHPSFSSDRSLGKEPGPGPGQGAWWAASTLLSRFLGSGAGASLSALISRSPAWPLDAGLSYTPSQ